MLKSIASFSLVFFFATASSTAAQSINQYWKDRTSRQNRARELRAEFAKLDARIPTLSPAEERWLKTEVDDEIVRAGNKYTKRAVDAMARREYAVRVAKPHAQEVIRVLDSIASTSIRDQRTEVALWVRLASLLMDHEFWQSVNDLVNKKVIGGIVDGLKEFYFETHVLWSQQILNEIVLSHLNGTLGR